MPVEYIDAWAAGFIDGEGSFTIAKHFNGEHNYKPSLQVSQTKIEPLELLQEHFKMGSIYELPRKTTKWNICWRWSVHSASSLKLIIPRLLPFLIVKREEAEIVLKFCDLIGYKGERKKYMEKGNIEQRKLFSDQLRRSRGKTNVPG